MCCDLLHPGRRKLQLAPRSCPRSLKGTHRPVGRPGSRGLGSIMLEHAPYSPVALSAWRDPPEEDKPSEAQPSETASRDPAQQLLLAGAAIGGVLVGGLLRRVFSRRVGRQTPARWLIVCREPVS